jgi:hypothetical protein
MKTGLLIVALILASACNRDPQPEAPTPAETERLNEAEAMLNELAKEEGAAREGTAPSNSK